jgi:hypothetical protein
MILKSTHHVKGLEHLTLVASTITVHRKRRRLLALVLRRECETSANRDLGTDNTVTTEEVRGKDVHGATLAVRHASRAAEELGEDTLDRAAAEDGEGVAAVGGDDEVLGCDGVFETDRDSFLYG